MRREGSDGYVQDIGCAHTYFHELAPSSLRFQLLVNGYGCAPDAGSYTYCELGYGQGVSANVHAASNPRGHFWGTDFNAAHAIYAQTLARDAGLNAHWLDLSFEALLDASTPSFDFIVLHGIWSWVGSGTQHALVEFLRRKLNPGGVVYISYNVVPGCNAEKPLRDLLWLHAECGSAAHGSTSARMAGALEFAQALRRHGSAFFRANPAASDALDDMVRQDTPSLAHEYFNSSWSPTYFNEVRRMLQAADLEFGCSMHISDISGEVRERLAGASFLDGPLDGLMRETAADFVLNRRFRRDVFVRSAPRLSPVRRLEKLDEVRFTLMRPATQVAAVVSTPYGQTVLEGSRLGPLLAILETASVPLSFAHLRRSSELQSWTAEEVLADLSTLVARRDICPVFADDLLARDGRSHAMNLAITRRTGSDLVRYLASPVAGAGIDANRFERAFWLCWQDGARGVRELARGAAALGADKPHGQESLEPRAAQFLMTTVPIWKKLGLTDEGER